MQEQTGQCHNNTHTIHASEKYTTPCYNSLFADYSLCIYVCTFVNVSESESESESVSVSVRRWSVGIQAGLCQWLCRPEVDRPWRVSS